MSKAVECIQLILQLFRRENTKEKLERALELTEEGIQQLRQLEENISALKVRSIELESIISRAQVGSLKPYHQLALC